METVTELKNKTTEKRKAEMNKENDKTKMEFIAKSSQKHKDD